MKIYFTCLNFAFCSFDIPNTGSSILLSNIEFFYRLNSGNIISIGELKNLVDNTIIDISTLEHGEIEFLFQYKTGNQEHNGANNDGGIAIEYYESGLSGYEEYLSLYDIDGYYNSTGFYVFHGGITTLKLNTNESDHVLKFKEFTYMMLPIPTLGLENCVVSPIELDRLDNPHTIILTPNNGYQFSNAPEITFQNIAGCGTRKETFKIQTDGTAILNNYSVGSAYISKFNVIADKKSEISDKYGLITLYKPSTEILKTIPSKLLHTIIHNENETETIDLSMAIISFLSIPLDIETFSTKQLSLMGVNIPDIEIDFINNNIHIVDFGSVDITGIYKNVIDYKYTSIELFLPFIGIVKLDTEKCMNKKLKLSYKVDLFTGDFLALCIIDGIIQYNYSGTLAVKIPYIVNTDKSITIGNYNLDKSNLIPDREPKIILSSNKPIQSSRISTMYIKAINSLTGFNKIELVTFSNSEKVLSHEIDEIKSILSSGIHI